MALAVKPRVARTAAMRPFRAAWPACSGFVIVPKFDQVFSSDGKTTYQMKDIKAGTFVKVYYDQKALGARHADKIYIYKSNSQFPSGSQ